MTALDDGLRIGAVFTRHFLTVGIGHLENLGFASIDHQEILHRFAPLIGMIAGTHQSSKQTFERHLHDNYFCRLWQPLTA
jgi:hypothetical protein